MVAALETCEALPVALPNASRVLPSAAAVLLFRESMWLSSCVGRGRKQRHLQDFMSLRICARERSVGKADRVVCVEGSCLRSAGSREGCGDEQEVVKTSGSSSRKARSRLEEARSSRTLRVTQGDEVFASCMCVWECVCFFPVTWGMTCQWFSWWVKQHLMLADEHWYKWIESSIYLPPRPNLLRARPTQRRGTVRAVREWRCRSGSTPASSSWLHRGEELWSRTGFKGKIGRDQGQEEIEERKLLLQEATACHTNYMTLYTL